MSRRLLALTIAAVAALAGCGGSEGSADEPGTIVPRTAYLYMEANLDPAGKQEDGVRTLLASLPGVGNPSRRLQEQFNAYPQRRYGRHAASFERDIKPWLGERMAAFLLLPRRGQDSSRAPSGLIASTRDAKKARHCYFWMGGKERLAYAIVDGFVVA